MEPDTEQTIASDADYGQSEDTNSGDSDLNSLLDEFEKGTTPNPQSKPDLVQTPAPSQTTERIVKPDLSKLDPVVRFAEAEMQRRQREEFDNDVNAAVDKIGEGDAFKNLPKNVTRRLLVAYAFDNKDFDKAFQNRADNPRAWEAALADAQTVLADEVKDLIVDKEAAERAAKDRDDIEAAVATVDGVTTDHGDDDDGPSAVQMSKMSDTEWQTFVEEELAKAS